jgi:hypothetical protein
MALASIRSIRATTSSPEPRISGRCMIATDHPGFLAAYNAGPKRYEEYLATARQLPVETQVYVAALAPVIGARQVEGTMTIAPREQAWQESALFAARNTRRVLAGSSPLAQSDRASVAHSAAGQFALQPRPDGCSSAGQLQGRCNDRRVARITHRANSAPMLVGYGRRDAPIIPRIRTAR